MIKKYLINISTLLQLTHFWYSSSEDFGMDLLSLEIQRGRDHGIPAYVHFRKYCNLSEISLFKDMRGITSKNVNIHTCILFIFFFLQIKVFITSRYFV